MKKNLFMSIVLAILLAATLCCAALAEENPYTETAVECESNGLTLRGMLTLPKDYEEGSKVPIVILSHGFMSNIRELAFAPHAIAYQLANAGYASVRFNFGGTPDSDGEFKDMTTSSEVEDLKSILSFVKTLDCVDTDNIFLSGNSFGGVVTALTAPQVADEINAIVLFFPAMSMCDDARGGHVQDVEFDTENVPDELQVHQFVVGRAFLEENLALDPYVPAAEYKGDVLILHGTADNLVPISSSEKLAGMYEHATLVPVEGGGHGFYDEATLGFAAEQMVDFLNAHLAAK